ncbi:MAG TPA: ATP-binding protein [Candidatus Binatia bacterium]|nr:ATP-binding protein [Candidatus Binatia bacterium]
MSDGRSRPRALVSWSSGKDSAWTLHVLRARADVEVVGLLCTLSAAHDRVAMHAVRRVLLEAQAAAVGLPLWTVPLPTPCPNDAYEAAMRAVLERARAAGISAMAFGDLFLADIRAYRERQLEGTGIHPLFPLWGCPTAVLAREMLGAGVRAHVTCVDPRRVSPDLAGRPWDTALLAALPGDADPCGENGEFHTFVSDGPMFRTAVPVQVGEIVAREGFVFADLLPGHPLPAS